MTVWRWAQVIAVLLLAGCASSSTAQRAGHRPQLGFQRLLAGPIWDDPARCREAFAAGARLPRPAYRLRVATWSLDRFPKPLGFHEPRDVSWLACAVAWLDAELLLLHAVALDADGTAAVDALVEQVRELAKAPWEWIADDVASGGASHTVLLYRPDRVQLAHFASYAGWGQGAAPEEEDSLPVATGVHVTSLTGNLDFHLISGRLPRSRTAKVYERRLRSWAGLQRILADRQRAVRDEDVVLAADLAACGSDDLEIPPYDEQARLQLALANLEPPLLSAASKPACSAFLRGWSFLGDQAATSRALLKSGLVDSRSLGICRASRCEPVDPQAALAARRLSRSCPVVLDLVDRSPGRAPATP